MAPDPAFNRSRASAGADGSELVYPLSDAHEWTLDNGLEVIVKQDRNAPVASVQAWCRVGSINEGRWLGAGMSHLLEHMLFKGTEGRTGQEIVEGVHDVGGYFNAYTSFNRTVYWIDTPREGVDTALEILCDIMTSASLPGEELEKEIEVIRREIAMGEDDPEQALSRLLFSTAFAVHPCRHPVIGTLDLLNRVGRDDLQEFYRAHYVPNNQFFVVVGDVEPEEVHARLAALHEGVSRGPLPPSVLPGEPRQLGRRDCHQEFATQLSRTCLAWHIPDVTHPDVPALDVLATVFGAGRSSRFYRVLREQEKLVHSVYAYAYTPAHEGLFMAGATVDPGKRGQVEDRILEMVATAVEEGIDEEELGKARTMALSEQLHSLTSMRGQASDLGSNWLLARNLDFSREYLDSLARVSAEDVRRVARAYLQPENLSVTSISPKGTLGARRTAGGEARGLAVARFELGNGLTVLVREDDRLPLVSCYGSFRGGVLAEEKSSSGGMRLLARLLLKGTKESSAEEISSRIESVGGSIGAGSGRNSLFVGLDVLRSELPEAMRTWSEICLEPVFPASELEKERESQLAAIRDAEDDPFQAASRLLREAHYGEHPYALDTKGTSETVAGIDRGFLEAERARTIAGSNGVLAVFGSVSGEEVRDLLEESFSGMPRGEQLFADRGAPVRGVLSESGRVRGDLDKSQAIVMIGFPGCNVFHEDRFALEVINEICSEMSSRLFLRIREDMGLAYTVGSSLSYGFDPGAFVFYAATAPEQADLVEEAMLDEIAKLATGGVTPEELQRSKRTFLGKRLVGRQSNDALSEALALDEMYGLGWEVAEKENREIEALTLERVNTAAESYLKEVPRVIARLDGQRGSH